MRYFEKMFFYEIAYPQKFKNCHPQSYICTKINPPKVDDMVVNGYYYFDKSIRSVELSTDNPEFCDHEYQMVVLWNLEYKMMLNQVTTAWLSWGTAIKPILHGYDGLKSYFSQEKCHIRFRKKIQKCDPQMVKAKWIYLADSIKNTKKNIYILAHSLKKLYLLKNQTFLKTFVFLYLKTEISQKMFC